MLRRVFAVIRLELAEAATRPLHLLWALFLVFNAYLMSRANWLYRSIDTSVGTQASWVNSEFQIAFVFALIVFLMMGFFIALAAGMPTVRDSGWRVDELLHASPLTVREYVWGRFGGSLLGILAVIAVFAASVLFWNHVFPDTSDPEVYGPLRLGNVLRPALVFLVPPAIFLAGAAFLLGAWTRRPILVFLLPVATMIFFNQFFWGWVPIDMEPATKSLFQWLDPSGFRWLKQNWLHTDRGIAFYNQNPIGYDAAFLASRLAWVVLGLLQVALAGSILGRRLRGKSPEPAAALAAAPTPVLPRGWSPGPGLAALGMRIQLPGSLRGAWTVARFELAELVFQPALYILLPVVFLTTFVLMEGAGQGNVAAVGGGGSSFNQPTLITSGIAAAIGYQFLIFWCLVLILFYAVESFHREESTGTASIYFATPISSAAVLIGKMLANVVVMAAVGLAVFAAAVLLVNVPLELGPFGLLWVVLFVPTLVLWLSFIACVYALTRGRLVTYGVALLVLAAYVGVGSLGYASWLTDFPASAIGFWSDMSVLELDRRVLWLNRLFVLALAAFFLRIALTRGRRADRELFRARRPSFWPTAGLALLAAAMGLAVWAEVNAGFQGSRVHKKHEDYWRLNLATFRDAALPEIDHATLAIALEPAKRNFTVDGKYRLINRTGAPLPWIPVTGGSFWKGLRWTLDGQPATPDDREGLYLFRLPQPLADGATIELGFDYSGTLPRGSSRNGQLGFTAEFMLPGGVVVTGRNPEFVPILGYDDKRGIDEDNGYEPAIFPADFHVGRTRGDNDRSPFTHQLTIDAPAEYTVNSTGRLAGVEERGGRKIWRWETDYPVRVFNIIAARYERKDGQAGTSVFYDQRHAYNVDQLLEALDGARTYFSEWFYPYPWKDMRLSEFPGLAPYARGNATNIFFAESMGFLGAPGHPVDVPLAIAIHEAAHSWWGHIVSHGEGPGGIVISEGGAQFATLMLLERLRGPAQRHFFSRAMEADFGENRQPSSEKPLAETFSHRPGDTTVIYNKGGWVLWMLREHMGHDKFQEGIREFFRVYHHNPDHPVLQDLVATLRPFAPDAAAYDHFCQQWFFGKEVPEYRIASASKKAVDGGFLVTVEVKNAGGTDMPVTVAGQRGFRFPEPSEDFAMCYGQLPSLAHDETKSLELRCDFEPTRIIVDPDVNVLQLQRQAASIKLLPLAKN